MSVSYQHSSLSVKYQITEIAWLVYIKYLEQCLCLAKNNLFQL